MHHRSNEEKSMVEKSDKQKAAHRLISEHLHYLSEHEKVIERMVERKWQEMLPRIEQAIDRKICEHTNK